MTHSNLLRAMACSLLILAIPSTYGQVDTSHGGTVGKSTFSERYALNSATPGNLTWENDPAGSGRKVLHARVRDTDTKVFGGLRTEISPQREYIREGVRWYAISVYFPADWEFHAYPTIVGQLHTSQKQTVLSPPLAFVVQGHNLDLELHRNHRPMDGIDPATKANSTKQSIRLERIKTEQWYCFVIRADWSSTPGKGNLNVWVNGDPVFEGKNQHNAYETWLGNYPKAGIYMPGMMGVHERHLYLDFIHLGGPQTTLDDMSALTPCGKS